MRSEQLDPVGEDLDAGTGVVLFDRFEAPAHASFDRHPPPDPQVVLADRGLAFVGDDVEEVRLFVVGRETASRNVQLVRPVELCRRSGSDATLPTRTAMFMR